MSLEAGSPRLRRNGSDLQVILQARALTTHKATYVILLLVGHYRVNTRMAQIDKNGCGKRSIGIAHGYVHLTKQFLNELVPNEGQHTCKPHQMNLADCSKTWCQPWTN